MSVCFERPKLLNTCTKMKILYFLFACLNFHFKQYIQENYAYIQLFFFTMPTVIFVAVFFSQGWHYNYNHKSNKNTQQWA